LGRGTKPNIIDGALPNLPKTDIYLGGFVISDRGAFGVLEYWRVEMLEMILNHYSNTPAFHYSGIIEFYQFKKPFC
jgi:hypothetical protein